MFLLHFISGKIPFKRRGGWTLLDWEPLSWRKAAACWQR